MIQTSADNRVQFDGDNMTWALRRSGSITVENGKLTVPASSSSIVALTGEVGKVAVQAGGDYISRTLSAIGQNGKVSTYFVFEEVATLQSGQPVLETCNAKGEVTFSSELYPLKALAAVERGQVFASNRAIAYVQIGSRMMVVDVTDYPPAAIIPTRINSLMRASNRMCGSSFWLGM